MIFDTVKLWHETRNLKLKSKLFKTYPETTTTKSMMFHMLRRYEFSWRMKPMAMILVHISTVKIPMNTGSSSSSCRDRMVLSLPAILESMDMTTQLLMMVMMITHSKGAQVTNQTNSLLNWKYLNSTVNKSMVYKGLWGSDVKVLNFNLQPLEYSCL